MAGLMSEKEIPKGWIEFKDRWYGVAASIEALKDIRSGLDAGFKKVISQINQDVSTVIEEGGVLVSSVQSIAPAKGETLKTLKGEIDSSMLEVLQDTEGIISRIKEYRGVYQRVSDIKGNLDAVQKDFSDQDQMANKYCKRLDEATKSYEAKMKNIKDATRVKLVNFRKAFIKELEPIFNGYDIVGNSAMDVASLFDALVEDPTYHQKVTVVSKGFGLGKKKSDAATRGLLLGYKAEEVIAHIKPVMEDERRRIEKFSGEEKTISELEIQCGDHRTEADKLKAKLEALGSEVAQEEAVLTEIANKLSSYDQVLSIRDRVLKKFNQSGGAVKELGPLVEESVKDYEPVEKDVEKRELKAELSELTKERNSLKGERDDLQSKLTGLSKKVEDYGKEIDRINDSLDSYKSEKSKLESENQSLTTQLNKTAADLEKTLDKVASVEKENQNLRKDLDTTRGDLKATLGKYESTSKELDKYKKALQDKEKEYQDLESKYKESSTELEELRSEVTRLDDEMMARIKSLESDIRKQTSGMLKSKSKRAMTQEEKQVEKKLDALRDKKA